MDTGKLENCSNSNTVLIYHDVVNNLVHFLQLLELYSIKHGRLCVKFKCFFLLLSRKKLSELHLRERRAIMPARIMKRTLPILIKMAKFSEENAWI